MEMFPMAQDCVIAFLQIPLINTSLVSLNSKMPSFWQIQYVVMSQHHDKPYREDTAGSEFLHSQHSFHERNVYMTYSARFKYMHQFCC